MFLFIRMLLLTHSPEMDMDNRVTLLEEVCHGIFVENFSFFFLQIRKVLSGHTDLNYRVLVLSKVTIEAVSFL